MIRLIQRRLIIPRGDTGSFTIPALASATSADIAVLTIFSCLTHSKIFDKIVNITGDTLNFTFTHSDTVNLPVGEYVWDIKFYKDPIYEDNKLINGTEIDSYYAGYKLPVCEIRETGDNLLVSDDAPHGTLTPNQIDIVNSALATLQVAITQTQANVEHYPKIENGNWYVWDASAGEYVDTGIAAQGQDGMPGKDGADGKDGTDGKDGVDGAPGKDGADGKDGKDGVTPSFSIGTVSTLEPDASATASITGTAAAPVLNLGIPQGQPAQLTPEIEGLPTRVTTIENNYAQQDGTYDNMTVGEAKAIDKEDDLTEIGAYNYRVTAGGTDIGRRDQEILEQVVGGTIAWNQMVRDEASPNETDFSEIVTVDDAVEDAAGVQVKIEPVQDLHGYDAPWPAGGGKNLFDISSQSSSSSVINNGDGSITVSSSSTSTGVTWGNRTLSQIVPNLVAGETYFLNATSTGLNKYIYCSVRWDFGTAKEVTQAMLDAVAYFYASGVSTTATIKDIIFCKNSETDKSFVPYSNICPITGWTGANVMRTGKNLLDTSDITDYSKWSADIAPSGNMSSASSNRIYSLPKLTSGLQYTISFGITSESFPTYLYFGYYKDGVSYRIEYVTTDIIQSSSITFSALEDVTYCLRMGSTYGQNSFNTQIAKLAYIQLELGSTATAYEPYQGETYNITFPSEAGTVYGGTLDVTNGELVVDRAIKTLSQNDNFTISQSTTRNRIAWSDYESVGKIGGLFISNILKSMPPSNGGSGTSDWEIWGSVAAPRCWISVPLSYTINDFKEWLSSNSVQLVYELATPITYTLTASEIHTILDKNNVWADTGDVSLTYIGTSDHFTLESGKKYLARISGTNSMLLGSGQEIVTAKGTDNVFNLTQMFGSTIADYIYSLETTTAGAGISWFKKLFPKDYYAYNAGELMSVQTSAHNLVGFNAYDSATGEAQLVSGMEYQITGAYTTLTFEGETITPDANGKFTPTTTGKLTVTGGNSTTTCVHLVWDGERDGEYQPYELHSYPLDDSLVLRGISKLDASNSLCYDGDTYEPDGTVTRRYGMVDLGTLNYSRASGSDNTFVFTSSSFAGKKIGIANIISDCFLTTTITSWTSSKPNNSICGSATSAIVVIRADSYENVNDLKTALNGYHAVYELATPTTETADPYTNPQLLDPYGTEEFVDCGTRDVAIPVGHKTIYQQQDLQSKLEDLPANPTEDGDFVLHHENSTNTYERLVLPPNLSTEVTQNSNNIDEILQDILDYQVFDNYTRRNGSIAVFTGKWANVYNVIFQHAIIPVNEGDTVFIEAPRNTYTVYAQLLNDDAPIQDEDAPLNGDAIQLAAGKTAEFTIDENTHYLYILVRRSYDRTDIITKVTINGILINRPLQTNINELVSNLANLTTQINTLLQNIGSLQSNVKYSLENGLQYYDGSTWQSING